jgi:DNA-binding NarL/FixJ family response regulator
VLRHLAGGRSEREIAAELYLARARTARLIS